jgi:hypothetical protein
MGCCESRDDHVQLPSLPAQLQASTASLTIHKANIEKLKPHITYFTQKSNSFFALVHSLRAAKRAYLGKFEELGTSVDRMIDLLSQLDTEVQAQFMSERESADMSHAELKAVIQAVRAQKQAKKLQTLAEGIQLYMEYPDRREEFNSQVIEKIEIVRKTSSSLLGYLQIIQEARSGIRMIIGMEKEWKGREEGEWQEAVERWRTQCEDAGKAVEKAMSQATHLLANFQLIESDLQSIKSEIDKAFEAAAHKHKALEAQSNAQQYLMLLDSELSAIPRKSYRNTIDKLITEQSTAITGSVYLEEFARVLRRLCLLSYYRDGPTMTPEETYERLLELLRSKAEADKAAAESIKERKPAAIPLELFLITQFSSGKPDKKSALADISGFMASLDAHLSSTRLGGLALELLRFTEAEPMSVHEESFLCRACHDLQPAIDQLSQSEDSASVWETAGLMRLSHVISLVEQWFTEEPKEGEEVILRLIPNLSIVDLTVYYVTMRLTERKMTAEDLFYLLDQRKANNLKREEFTVDLRSTLSLMLASEQLEEVATILDKTNSNGIFRTEFNDLFDVGKYEKLEEKLRVRRVDVLNALRIVYAEWKSELNSQLYLEFLLMPKDNNRVAIENTRALLLNIEPELTDMQVEAFTKQLQAVSEDYFPLESFRDCFFQYPLGAAGKSFFCER